MALITCRICDGQVSTDAEACPHCGTPSYRFSPFMRFIIGVIVIGSMIYALLWAADSGLLTRVVDAIR